MLLGQPWVVAAKVTHDWGSYEVIIDGNGTLQIISVLPRTGPWPQLPKVLIYYNFAKGLIDHQESIYLKFELDLIPIGKFTLLGPPLLDPNTERFDCVLTY